MNWKNILLVFLVAVLTASACSNKPVDLLGDFDRVKLEEKPYDAWYKTELADYQLDTESLDSLDLTALKNLEIIVFLGTWCSDSQREVPRFLKILDYLKIDPAIIQLTGLDRNKTAPDYQDNAWNIEFVPTMIFIREGKEIGRIIETPEISLEQDLNNILSETVLPTN